MILVSSKPKVLFFGTGPVAAQSLKLLSRHTDIEAVITKPKPNHHKGDFPVIDVANQINSPIYYVNNKTDVSSLFKSAEFSSSLGVLIDFGIIVAKDVIDNFDKGIINSHFSLLPEWRGADPITFSILSGQKKTGVSLMLLVEAMDEGPILATSVLQLNGQETTPSLTQLLIEASDALLENEISKYVNGTTLPKPQSINNGPHTLSYSRKLTKADGKINWETPAVEIERQIRAFSQWPKSYTTLGSIDVIITKAAVHAATNSTPGTVVVDDKNLLVHTAKDYLEILEIQPAGKKPMSATAFIAGYGSRLNLEKS